MKKMIIPIMMVLAAFAFTACDEEKVPLDSPFVYIQDTNGTSSMNIEWDANNYLTTLYVTINSKTLDHDVTVGYEMIVGDGLTENVDYRVQSSTQNSITFVKGIRSMPLRVIWLKHELDTTKDNTITFRLTECSDSNFTLGYLSLTDKHLFSEYVFTKRVVAEE